MPLADFLYTDRARLDAYFEQISAPVVYEKVPVWKAGFSLTGPSAEGTQTRVARTLTQFEKLRRLVEHLRKKRLVSIVNSQAQRRDARTPFRLETCTAVKVRVPASSGLSDAEGRGMTLWIADPLEREDADTRHTCTLCLMESFTRAC